MFLANSWEYFTSAFDNKQIYDFWGINGELSLQLQQNEEPVNTSAPWNFLSLEELHVVAHQEETIREKSLVGFRALGGKGKTTVQEWSFWLKLLRIISSRGFFSAKVYIVRTKLLNRFVFHFTSLLKNCSGKLKYCLEHCETSA